MDITPAQCRAARALVNWSQDRLATEAEVAKKTIADFEREVRQPYPRTIAALRTVLEAVGVEFTNGDAPGVRLHGARTAVSNGSGPDQPSVHATKRGGSRSAEALAPV